MATTAEISSSKATSSKFSSIDPRGVQLVRDGLFHLGISIRGGRRYRVCRGAGAPRDSGKRVRSCRNIALSILALLPLPPPRDGVLNEGQIFHQRLKEVSLSRFIGCSQDR